MVIHTQLCQPDQVRNAPTAARPRPASRRQERGGEEGGCAVKWRHRGAQAAPSGARGHKYTGRWARRRDLQPQLRPLYAINSR